ncbi:MAG: hypothetical protein M1541_18175 [Acidobacteria bacterium]|nr:hypothetical protein [Acidobacteriota bacterium]
MLCADMVEVAWVDQAGQPRSYTGLLEDICSTGACVQMDVPVPVETNVRVQCGKTVLEGVVRYCIFREIGYFAGIEFGEGSRWSRERFEPQHLLDLATLIPRQKPN